MSNFDHWLITRFNVPLPGCPGRSTDSDWLDHRLRLFTAYCLPSVEHQSCQAFRWLLLLDRDTPPPRVDAILGWRKDRSFDLLPVGQNWVAELAAHLAGESRSPFLLTSRLDNDDAIHPDYMNIVQEAFQDQGFEFLEMPCGFKLDETRHELYSTRYRSGPFLSLVERLAGSPKTVYCCNHTRTPEFGPLRELNLEPAWLQIVHTHNLVNRIEHGLTRVSLSRLKVDFPGLRLSC
jgi:hypothetical protein